jgi:hypothetical protein
LALRSIGLPEGLVIDHIDSDRSNNKIENLRLATRTQNGTRSFSNARAGWKGVQWTANGTYQSILPLNSVNLVLGTFGGAADAALMYNFVAAEWYGQFARYNEAEQTWFDNGSEVAVDIVKPR